MQQSDLKAYLNFLQQYIKTKILNFGQSFEKGKDIIVAFLIAKRGRYSTSFLNTSFVILVVTVITVGPLIAENNPFSSSYSAKNNYYQATVISYNPYESSLTTKSAMDKARSDIIDYKVVSGDTLASIARKFDISVDTIKWANDLTNDTIKTDQTLKIPPITGIVHKVKSGDNIYSIAKKYKVDAQKIINYPFNDYADLDIFTLSVGQNLFVPDGVIQEENVVSPAGFFAQVRAGIKGTSHFIQPTSGMITQYYIWYHQAIDIASNALPPILASDTGTVTYAGCLNWGYGCHIIIDHANGYQTLYGHLSAISVSPGQAVSQGQRIGTMGSTGRSTGPHLHFEIRSGGQPLDPLGFIR